MQRQSAGVALFVGGTSKARIIGTLGWFPVLGYLVYLLLYFYGGSAFKNSAFVTSGASSSLSYLPVSILGISTILLIALIAWLAVAKRYLFFEHSLNVVRAGSGKLLREIPYSSITDCDVTTVTRTNNRSTTYVKQLRLTVAGDKKVLTITPPPRSKVKGLYDVCTLIRGGSVAAH